ncbi:MAG: hypothetical protein IPK72_13695 [Candidatus Eisenbacteria bacterium]|nr:hypothetical protein [Candidatus Eisenbacteria bacterium]
MTANQHKIAMIATALLLTHGSAWAGRGEEVGQVQPSRETPGKHAPTLFPPSKAGYPGEWRDPRDIAPYLAFHQARAAQGHSPLLTLPTPNQGLYDARYYDLDLTLSPSTSLLTGTVRAVLTVTGGPLSQIDLDLASNLTVSAVTVGGNATTFTRPTNLLRVDLDRPYATSETVDLSISYSGNPNGDAFAWDSFGGQSLVWTLSEPFGARTWWPCKDYPDDKADSVDIRITAPTGHRTASNGSLRSESDNGTVAQTWWHEGHPIATYLVSLASHPYTVYNDWYVSSPTDSTELRFWSIPSHVANNQPIDFLVKDMIAAFATRFGEYPFPDEKYGHAEFLWGGGMEHQTCSSMGFYSESIAAHELAHQWFGDAVTCKTFEHIWLNEGFATYGEALWEEQNGGYDAYIADMLLNQFFGPGTIYVPPTDDFNRIFDPNLSYAKASWVLHMLRHVTGDAAFFDILETYRTQYFGRSADTAEFQAGAESVSGLDLDAFFTQWIYGEGAPVYSYSWSATPAGPGYDIALHIDQIQSGQTFTMPLDIQITTASGSETQVVQNSLAAQDFVLHTTEEPTAVALDPKQWVLRIVMDPIPTPTFARDLLLVNGVSWDTYGSEIRSAYTDKAFWGDYAIDFWDYFPTPSGGYPATLPAPLGHGKVTPAVLAQYKNVIWIGNNLSGDLDGWFGTPIYSYLQAGGNVLLLTRFGEDFLIEPYRDYLGVDFLSTVTLNDCVSAYVGLSNIARLGTQSFNATFDLAVTSPSVLLYRAESGFTPDRGIGVYKAPPGGGTFNPNGGRFIFLSGRPYRWNHAQIQTNVEFMLQNFFGLSATDAPETSLSSVSTGLSELWPNPSTGATEIRFGLAAAGPVALHIYDVRGRRVRTLVEGSLDPGWHEVIWDGRNGRGETSAAGIYFARLIAGGQTDRAQIIRVR